MTRARPLVAALALTVLLGPALTGGTAAEAQRRAPTLMIEYVAHASFLLTSRAGDSVLIDPFASRVWLGYDFPAGLEPDAVLITHPHYDHDAGRYRGAPFPWDDEVPVIDGPGRFRVGELEITGIRGKHADPYGKEFGQLNTIFVIEVDGVRVAHWGDNGLPTGTHVRQLGALDFLLLPIDSEYHILSQAEIDLIVGTVQPRVLVPMHYRHPDLEVEPDSPDDLGGIEGWLEGRDGLERVGSHRLRVQAGRLPEPGTILLFEHSPEVRRREP